MGETMNRLRSRTSTTIIVTIFFVLLVITYHLLSSEAEESSTPRREARIELEEAYKLNEMTESPEQVLKRHRYEARLIGKWNSSNVPGYRDNHETINKGDAILKGHKIVHLDLKGAPPVLAYYKDLLVLLKKLGATGILLEYEDTFPFDGEIRGIAAKNAYSREDINAILELAKKNDLVVIPLVQTFGHLEFVLKLKEYKDYREVFRYPQVICPTYNKTLSLIYEMIDQVANAHPNSRYIHIGADEVYHLGKCPRCVETMNRNHWTKRKLFLDYVATIARRIKDKYPRLTILMWDDEFRETTPREIRESGLHRLVEPVIWKYTTDPAAALTPGLWENYASVWSAVWIATAFKGATKPDRYYTDISHHTVNHAKWLELVAKYSSRMEFRGAVLTGWQRYDHFAVLCELLATAVPSLAINLAILQSSTLSDHPSQLSSRTAKILECDAPVSLNIPEPQYAWTRCNYAGVKVYAATFRLYNLQQEIAKMEEDSAFTGWLKPYNIKHSFSNPNYVEYALAELDRYRMDAQHIEREIRDAMEDVYDSYTVDEWLETYLSPLYAKLGDLLLAREKMLQLNAWPRRPIAKNEL